MSGRCKNCKWWHEEQGGADDPGWCANEKLDSDSPDGLRYSRDTSGWQIAGPEFGCVHFTAKGSSDGSCEPS